MSTEATLKVKAVVGERYTLREPVGDWGVGETWAADDTRFEGRVVVLKFLPKADDALAEAIDARLEAVRSLRHASILPVVDHGVWAGRHYAVHEHGPLRSLGTWLDEHRALGQLPPLAQIKAVFAQTCEALVAGRNESTAVLHEGISPASVMLRGTDELQARVMDFGIVPFADPIAAEAGSARGVACMAPEQFQGEEPDARTDVFGLALLLMEMLSAPPDPTAPAGAYRGRGDVPPAVWQVLQRAIRTQRDERYSTADALLNASTAAWDVAPPPEAAAPAAAPPADPEAAPAVEAAPAALHDAPAPPAVEPAPAGPFLVMPTLTVPEPAGLASTAVMDFSALFPDAGAGAGDIESTIRSNRDPRALAEIARRYRTSVSAKPPRAEPFPIAPPRAPEPAPAPAPAPESAVEPADEPDDGPDAQRTLRLVLAVAAGFAAVLALAWFFLRGRH